MKSNQSLGILAVLVSAILAFSGCNPQGNDSGGPDCSTGKFDKSLQPLEVHDNSRIDFDSSDLDALADPSLQIDTAYLRATVDGDYKGKDDEIGLDLNGLQASSSGSSSYYELLDHPAPSASDVGFHMEEMSLNGAEAVTAALARIINNRGQLEVGLHASGIVVSGASLELTGTSFAGCPSAGPSPGASPSPSPSPGVDPGKGPPHTTITSVSPTGATVASTSMSIAFDSDQSHVNFQCSLDGATAAACASPALYSGLANGQHSFHVVAVNPGGVADQTGASYTWTVDTVPPDVTITNAASLPSITNSQTITIAFSAKDAVSFTCALDGTAKTCASPVTYNGLTEGVHQVSISATNPAGVVSTTPAVFQWTVDLTPPTMTLNQITPSQTITNSTSISFAFSANETSTFQCTVDNGTPETCQSPFQVSSLQAGSHSFSVVATDVAGNVSQPATYLWTVDLTPPVLTLGQVTPPAGYTNATSVSVEFSANKVVTFSCTLDGVAAASCASPFTSPISTAGAHEVQITAVDQAGNSATQPLVVDWTMDYDLPQISWGTMVPSASSYINTTSFQADVTASETVTLASTLNGTELNQTASPISLSNLSEGVYTLSVTPTDLGGNVGTAITHVFTVDLTPPVVTLSAAITGLTNQTTNTFTFSASETSTFQCNLDNQGYSACGSPVNVSGLAEGNHQFQVTATDLAGNVGAVQSVSWSIQLTPPVVTVTPSRTSNSAISFTLSANESVQGYQCSLDGAAYGSCSTPVSYTGLAVGSHTFSAEATDLAGNLSTPATYNWSVNPPPTTTITSTVPGAVDSTSMSISFSSNDSSATFVCSLDGAAASPCTSPASYSGLSLGSHSFRVYAVDPYAGQDPTGASATWTVQSPLTVSGLSYSPARYSITVSWSTSNPATSAISWSGGSSGSIGEDQNYVTSHSITVSSLLQGRAYNFTVSGHDASGAAYSQSGSADTL